MTRTEIGRRSDALWKDDERYHRRDLCDMVAYREDDVERLRELVRDMWTSVTWMGPMSNNKRKEYRDRMHEMGVEVEE